MAIEFVGTRTFGKSGATSGDSTIPLNSGLTGGSRAAVQTGDLVIGIFSSGSVADRTLAIKDVVPTFYTLIGSELYSDGSSFDTNLRVAYKFMGGSPDNDAYFGPTGNAADAGVCTVFVFAGVDSTTPFDVAVTTATGTGTGRADPPAITPVTAGAYVLAIGAGSAATGAVFTSSDLTGFSSTSQVDTQDSFLGAGYVAWTSGAVDPAQFGGGTTGATESWAAMSIALRPAAVAAFIARPPRIVSQQSLDRASSW